MASKHTSGYKLCQWEASDEVLRTDFNEDNSKIDAALKALDEKKIPQIVCSWYRGDGNASRRVELGFVPDAVITFCSNPPSRYGDSLYGGLAVVGSWPQLTVGSRTYDGLKIINQGFTVWETNTGSSTAAVHCNMKDVEYAYVAIKL